MHFCYTLSFFICVRRINNNNGQRVRAKAAKCATDWTNKKRVNKNAANVLLYIAHTYWGWMLIETFSLYRCVQCTALLFSAPWIKCSVVMDRKIVDRNCTIKNQPKLNCVHACMCVCVLSQVNRFRGNPNAKCLLFYLFVVFCVLI